MDEPIYVYDEETHRWQNVNTGMWYWDDPAYTLEEIKGRNKSRALLERDS